MFEQKLYLALSNALVEAATSAFAHAARLPLRFPLCETFCQHRTDLPRLENLVERPTWKPSEYSPVDPCRERPVQARTSATLQCRESRIEHRFHFDARAAVLQTKQQGNQ